MFATLAQSLAVASIGLVAPGSITLVILLLMSDRGWRNGLAFVLGYVIMYSLIGAGVLLWGVNAFESSSSEQGLSTSILFTGLGTLFLALTVRNWRNRPQTATPTGMPENQPSRFTRLIDGSTPLKSFALAATVSLINVKNLTIFLSAVSVLLLSDLWLSTKLLMLIPLVLVFCTSVITPLLIYAAFPERAADYLTRIKETIARHSRSLGIAVTLILGLLLSYRGITGFL